MLLAILAAILADVNRLSVHKQAFSRAFQKPVLGGHCQQQLNTITAASVRMPVLGGQAHLAHEDPLLQSTTSCFASKDNLKHQTIQTFLSKNSSKLLSASSGTSRDKGCRHSHITATVATQMR